MAQPLEFNLYYFRKRFDVMYLGLIFFTSQKPSISRVCRLFSYTALVQTPPKKNVSFKLDSCQRIEKPTEELLFCLLTAQAGRVGLFWYDVRTNREFLSGYAFLCSLTPFDRFPMTNTT